MKRISALVLVAATVLAALAFTGCSVVNGITKDEVLGTYKLTKYEHSRYLDSANGEAAENSPREEEVIDKIAEGQIVSYLVIKSIDGVDGWGIYVYGDKEAELAATEVKLEITYDTQKPELVTGIRYRFMNGKTGPSLGVNGKVLNYYLPAYEIGSLVNEYNIDMEYSRVSEATDLTHVKAETGKDLICVQFELAHLVGQNHVDFDFSANSSLAYFYAKVAVDGKTADIAYGVKGEGREVIPHEKTGVKVAFDRETRLLTIGEFTFEDPIIRAFLEERGGETVRVGYLYKETDAKTKEEIIEADLNEYYAVYDLNNPPLTE